MKISSEILYTYTDCIVENCIQNPAQNKDFVVTPRFFARMVQFFTLLLHKAAKMPRQLFAPRFLTFSKLVFGGGGGIWRWHF
jgi:hypothetical protein